MKVTVQQLGHVAQAMNHVQQQKLPDRDVIGTMRCPRCGSRLHFNIQRSGISRGQCITGTRCVSWCQ